MNAKLTASIWFPHISNYCMYQHVVNTFVTVDTGSFSLPQPWPNFNELTMVFDDILATNTSCLFLPTCLDSRPANPPFPQLLPCFFDFTTSSDQLFSLLEGVKRELGKFSAGLDLTKRSTDVFASSTPCWMYWYDKSSRTFTFFLSL